MKRCSQRKPSMFRRYTDSDTFMEICKKLNLAEWEDLANEPVPYRYTDQEKFIERVTTTRTHLQKKLLEEIL